jgi:rSAM/selenodomain-associated transferase 2
MGSVSETPQLSIIVPVLNEALGMPQMLARLQPCRHESCEIIVVDGGSSDNTVQLATGLADQIVTSPSGRGCQMNTGAALARGRCCSFCMPIPNCRPRPPPLIRQAIEQGASWGRFDVRIEGTVSGLGLVAFMMNWRSRLSGIATGDQAIFVTREAFDRIGGFPDIPLMEDIVFSSQLRALSRPACLTEKVATSGRRWEKHGVLRTILLMWQLRLRFFFGANPHDLAREYGYAPRKS